MEKLKRAYDWLTPARRRKMYAMSVIVGSWFVARGFLTAEDLRAVVETVGLALGVIAVPAIAGANVQED